MKIESHPTLSMYKVIFDDGRIQYDCNGLWYGNESAFIDFKTTDWYNPEKKYDVYTRYATVIIKEL